MDVWGVSAYSSERPQMFPCHALLSWLVCFEIFLATNSYWKNIDVLPPRKVMAIQKGKGYMYLQGNIQVWQP